MGSELVAYVHKRCKTCKRATDYLDGRGVAYEPRELYEDTPSKEELRDFLRRLDLPAKDLLRPRDKMYRELNLKEQKTELTEEELLDLMAEHPGLIKRPVLVKGDQVALGLKEEAVEAFLAKVE